MVLKRGSKQTEVGLIPEDWEVKEIGAVNPFVTSGSRGWASFYSDVGHPFIRITNLSRESIYLDLDATKYVNLPPNENEGKRTQLLDGDVLISITADIGIIGYVTPSVPKPAFINQHIALVRFPSASANSQYISYFLASKNSQDKFQAMTDKGAKAGMNLLTVQKILLALPPLPEQNAIAAALTDVDALLTSLDALIAKKRVIKQGAMQELLTGKTRLPGFKKLDSYRQTEIGMLPNDWETKHLGELFEITSSKRVFQSEWRSNGIPFYRARELAVLGEKGYVNNELFITKEMYSAYKNAYGVPQKGDLLVTGVGTLGKVYVVPNEEDFYFKDGNIIWFKVFGKVNSEFLRQLYLTPLITKQIEETAAGSTVGTYTISSAKKTLIPFPSLEEQQAIAVVISDMETDIRSLENQREKIRQIKEGMMQELLTGRTRLI